MRTCKSDSSRSSTLSSRKVASKTGCSREKRQLLQPLPAFSARLLHIGSMQTSSLLSHSRPLMQDLLSQAQLGSSHWTQQLLFHIQHNCALAMTRLHLCSCLSCIVRLQLLVVSPRPGPVSHHFEPMGDLTYQMLELYVRQNASDTATTLLSLACTIANSAAWTVVKQNFRCGCGNSQRTTGQSMFRGS